MSCTKVLKVAVLAFSVFVGFQVKTYVVKADTVTTTQQGVSLKSTNLVTNKTVKVPVKAQPVNTSTTSSSSSSANYSRGSSGGSTIASGSTSSLVNKAFEFLGRPYVYGASGPRAFDCSGFTAYVYQAFGVSLPHYTVSQSQMGMAVSKNNLKAGDLVFFNTAGYISHVGIYIGGGQFIHASSGSGKITVSDIGEGYYLSRYVCARRILN